MYAVAVAGRVWKIVRNNDEEVEDLRSHYKNIRESLIHAVRDIHVPHEFVSDEVKIKLRQIYSGYDYVYTTNYDLLLYWVIMDEKDQFKDFYWSKVAEEDRVTFDISDTAVWGDVTKILYLHGALHLFHNVSDTTYKAVGNDEGSILEQFRKNLKSIPLFISEGTSKDKMRSIRRNDYLSFAYERFATHRGSLVVFGHSLNSEFDQHIIDAMKRWTRYDQKRFHGRTKERTIAFSIHPSMSSGAIIEYKSRIQKSLSRYKLRYFNSETHPLGSADLRINQENA